MSTHTSFVRVCLRSRVLTLALDRYAGAANPAAAAEPAIQRTMTEPSHKLRIYSPQANPSKSSRDRLPHRQFRVSTPARAAIRSDETDGRMRTAPAGLLWPEHSFDEAALRGGTPSYLQ